MPEVEKGHMPDVIVGEVSELSDAKLQPLMGNAGQREFAEKMDQEHDRFEIIDGKLVDRHEQEPVDLSSIVAGEIISRKQ